MTTKPSINGEKIHSQTLDHFTSYPVVSDLLSIYQSNSLGKKSIDLYNKAYSTFAEPIVPHLQTPYSYAKPYLVKVDALGTSSLDVVDNYFPAVTKTNIDQLREYAVGTAQYPFKVAGQGKDYFFSTWDDEYKKSGGEGIVYRGYSLISTDIRILAEAIRSFGDFIGPKSDELRSKLNGLAKDGKKEAEKAADTASAKAGEAKKTASAKADEAKKQLNSH